MYKLLFEKFLQQFIKAVGRKPQTRKELMSIQDDVVRYLNKTKGVPEKKPTSPFQGFTPKVIQGGKSKEGITSIPVNKQIQDLKTFEREVIDELNAPIKPDLEVIKGGKKEGLAGIEQRAKKIEDINTQLKKALEERKAMLPGSKDKTLFKDSPEAIAKMKAENKAAIKRLKDKKKTVEDFKDDGDFDPGGMASGGIAGQLHMNEGGRARFANGSPLVDARMHNTYAENIAANEAQRQANFEYLKQQTQQTGFDDPRKLHENLDQLTGGARGSAGLITSDAPTDDDIWAAIAANTPNKTPDQLIAEQAYTDLGGGITSAHKAPISSLNLATSPESRITNEAQANMLAELMAPGSTLPQQYQKPSFQERMGGESWDMLSDGDQYRIAQEYPGQTPPRRNLGFIPSNFAKGGRVSLSNGGLANILGV